MAFLAGLDKFLNLLTNWEQYVSPLAQKMLPLSPTSLMHVVGVIEMVVGLAILTKATRLGAYVASAWLVCIALALLTTGHFFDVAVRSGTGRGGLCAGPAHGDPRKQRRGKRQPGTIVAGCVRLKLEG
jgi:uncharacterized membrane protein YphA (DoxX/SURF4 family)